MSIEQLIENVIEREGGYVNHPADRGGPTNMGITLLVLKAWRRDWNQTAEDVEKLPRQEAAAIYRSLYWEKPRFDLLDVSPQVQEMLFDSAVHHGPGRAVIMLQRCVGVVDDGIIGPITAGVVGRLSGPTLSARFMAMRISFFGDLITRDPSQAVFARGWMNRMKEFILMIPHEEA